jgi:hypothetical protein
VVGTSVSLWRIDPFTAYQKDVGRGRIIHDSGEWRSATCCPGLFARTPDALSLRQMAHSAGAGAFHTGARSAAESREPSDPPNPGRSHAGLRLTTVTIDNPTSVPLPDPHTVRTSVCRDGSSRRPVEGSAYGTTAMPSQQQKCGE